MRLSEIMTAGVITATAEASALEVARLMRDHRVGSVVIVDSAEKPVAMLTDRDLALRVFAEGAESRCRRCSTLRDRWSAASRRWSSTRPPP